MAGPQAAIAAAALQAADDPRLAAQLSGLLQQLSPVVLKHVEFALGDARALSHAVGRAAFGGRADSFAYKPEAGDDQPGIGWWVAGGLASAAVVAAAVVAFAAGKRKRRPRSRRPGTVTVTGPGGIEVELEGPGVPSLPLPKLPDIGTPPGWPGGLVFPRIPGF